MTVPDEAVEAAAKAFYGDAYEDIFQADKEFPQAQMREAIAAAAPFVAAQVRARDELFAGFAEDARVDHQGRNAVRELSSLIAAKAQAWDEGARAMFVDDPFKPTPTNPYRSQA